MLCFSVSIFYSKIDLFCLWLFWSFYPNVYSGIFPSSALSLVVTISLPLRLAEFLIQI